MSRGTRFESAVQAALEDAGIPAIKPTQSGFVDLGDLQADPFVLQCKDYMNVSDGVREALSGAERQAQATGLTPAGVVRRRGFTAAGAYVVMSLDDFAEVIRAVRDGTPLPDWRVNNV